LSKTESKADLLFEIIKTWFKLYEKMIEQLQTDSGKPIQTGVFGADMKIELLNDGPITIIIDSKNKQ
jgi:D-tyrosyl-tRNA(Tyr) deacylase